MPTPTRPLSVQCKIGQIGTSPGVRGTSTCRVVDDATLPQRTIMMRRSQLTAYVDHWTNGIRGDVLVVGGLRIGGAGALMAMHMVMARRLGPGEYGEFTMILAIAGTAVTVAPLGWPLAAVRFVAVYLVSANHDLLRGFLRASHLVTLAGGTAAGAILLVAAEWTPSPVAPAVRLAGLLTPVWALSFLRMRVFQGFGRMRASLLPEQMVLPLIMIAAGLSVGFMSAAAYVYVLIATHVVTLIIQTPYLWTPDSLAQASRAPRFEMRIWWATSLPLVVSGAGRLLLNRVDVLMIGAMMGTVDAGVYGAANRLSLLIVLGITALTTVLMPRLAAEYSRGDMISFRRTIRISHALGVATAAVPAVLMIGVPRVFVWLFGAGFEGSEPLVRILALGGFLAVVSGVGTVAMAMIGEHRRLAYFTLGAVVINILGNGLAIPVYGAAGAATVSVISLLVIHVPSVLVVHARSHE